MDSNKFRIPLSGLTLTQFLACPKPGQQFHKPSSIKLILCFDWTILEYEYKHFTRKFCDHKAWSFDFCQLYFFSHREIKQKCQ